MNRNYNDLRQEVREWETILRELSGLSRSTIVTLALWASDNGLLSKDENNLLIKYGGSL